MKHRVIEGRIFRSLKLEAADTKQASQHVSAQKPVSHATQVATRRAFEVRAL